jgi:hypothetical protein
LLLLGFSSDFEENKGVSEEDPRRQREPKGEAIGRQREGKPDEWGKSAFSSQRLNFIRGCLAR